MTSTLRVAIVGGGIARKCLPAPSQFRIAPDGQETLAAATTPRYAIDPENSGRAANFAAR